MQWCWSEVMDASCVLSSYIKLSLLSRLSEWLPTTRLPTVSLSATSPSLFSAPAPDTASVLSPTSPHTHHPGENVQPRPASSQQPLGHGTIKKTRQELSRSCHAGSQMGSCCSGRGGESLVLEPKENNTLYVCCT